MGTRTAGPKVMSAGPEASKGERWPEFSVTQMDVAMAVIMTEPLMGVIFLWAITPPGLPMAALRPSIERGERRV
jgi:hypothetical protein